MREMGPKLCCPHCEYKTAAFGVFSDGVVRDGWLAMSQHIRNRHPEKVPSGPTRQKIVSGQFSL